MKHWPLKGKTPLFPDSPGRFKLKRKYDYHTGIDLYCELGQEVVAIEGGVVITVESFTGKKADSAWWNDTEAILVKGESGVFNYGEVTPLVKEGDEVKAGQTIAIINTAVLKSFKGRPMVMLHLELLSHESTTSPWWYIDGDGKVDLKQYLTSRKKGVTRLANIWNPEDILKEIAGDSLTKFDLSLYDGLKYKDANAPEKDSKWWNYWSEGFRRRSEDLS